MSIPSPYPALVARGDSAASNRCTLEQLSSSELPPGDVLLEIRYSSLNYKDALSATGNRGVTRTYPHVPGIDAAGVVLESKSPDYSPGDEVIITGYEFGSNRWGGYTRYTRVPAEWLVKKPASLTLRETMIYGTAGFTVALCLWKMELNGMIPKTGPVLVTGATGGVGSIAVMLLAHLGFEVCAVTGKSTQKQWLKELGAKEVLSREEAMDSSGKPLLGERWAGVIDTVGGTILETAIRSVKIGGSVASCGLTQSPFLQTSVYPFILRGVNLLGISSMHCPMSVRRLLWNHLSRDWKPEGLDRVAREVELSELPPLFAQILKGGLSGRTVVSCAP